MSLATLFFPKTAIMDYWPLITYQEAELIGCNENRLLAKVQERYGIPEQSAFNQVMAFIRSYDSPERSRTWLTKYGHSSK